MLTPCAHELHSSFSERGNSDNSAISVKGKGLTNHNMYAGRKVFKGKISLQEHQIPCTSSAAGSALLLSIMHYFLRGHKIYYCVANNHMNNS